MRASFVLFSGVVAALVVSVPFVARAQNTPAPAATGSSSPAAPSSITDQVMEKRRRIEEFSRLMKDANPSTRQAALQLALKDQDPVIRGSALDAYLKRFSALTPEVEMDKNSQIAQDDVPRLAIASLAWSDDGVSASGVYYSPCSYSTTARLQVAGGKLAIAYEGVCIRPVLLGIDTGGDSVKAAKAVLTACQLTLTPNADDTSLDGPLHCVGVAEALPVKLPFGP